MQSSQFAGSAVPYVYGSSRVAGVFGCPIEHSLSPAMHNAAYAALQLSFIYTPFHVEPGDLGAAIGSITALGMAGVNLTIPHKEAAIPFLDRLTDSAAECGAVNTVLPEDGRLLGDNTDGDGFWQPLHDRGFDAAGEHALILGAGGSARVVALTLLKKGARVRVANRSGGRAEKLVAWLRNLGYSDIEQVEYNAAGLREAAVTAGLLVNATPVGMWPATTDELPAPLSRLRKGMLVVDLVYNPEQTALLRTAQDAGCETVSGVEMLVAQGASAFRMFTGVDAPVDVMTQAVRAGLTGVAKTPGR
ncbi:MAG: shikimate dehydrogenase [Armatimonadetes bacterium]|nr:shikimate dehydrogenase [Armatimonadota bacterium]MDE2205279.1 shikimate dehydrogenase [Armatimonadota bacterium]